ncbi:thioesterase family protein [Bradyrhizobium yuanmingense]|uniref:acyl-CoA thioesterase n=1 Tax=Bradyrhizobium yuanmingense TaxID=108015 RepID=UPI0023B904B8|nr:thioesterase family protein [Bradyrhizobium yuanmingense]MDF0523430.1 thioesterase family protein [Bradyrhizobium yuanmingense]
MTVSLERPCNELSPTARRIFGIDGDWNFGMVRETGWSDVDSNSHVNNLTFLKWCEDVRIRYFYDITGHWPDISKHTLVVRSLSFNFERGLQLGDRVFVTARTSKIGTTSWVQEYAVWHGNLIGRGDAVCVFIDATGSKSPITSHLKGCIRRIDRNVG